MLLLVHLKKYEIGSRQYRWHFDINRTSMAAMVVGNSNLDYGKRCQSMAAMAAGARACNIS